MEVITLSKEDIPDFKSFTADPAVKCINVLSNEKFVELLYNTNQKFVMSPELYQEVAGKYSNDLIFGKDKTERIVSIEIDDENLHIFKETDDGITVETRPNTFWIVTADKLNSHQKQLQGNQPYKWLATFDNKKDYQQACWKVNNYDHYRISNLKESSMVYNGITYYKGLTPADISVLSFDLESDGLVQHNDSEIYLITNTFRSKKYTEKKTFRLDRYKSQADMLIDWVKWVKEKDPSILLGHNILGYDFRYIFHVANLHNIDISIGRDGSVPQVASYVSKFRKDGSQSYDYNDIWIYGREVVDTMFLAIKYDIGRKYESYRLKEIVRHEGMEKEGRSFVDASKIKHYYNNRHQDPEMWEKVVQYGEEDSDDALKLFDLMAPSYFYFTQSVSKSFQQMINQATGSQINNMMVRAYFQEGKSIAKADANGAFEGAISFGLPGLYKNVFKLDVASLYPSIILQYQIYNKTKDPEAKFLQMMEYFTAERLKNKALAAQTRDKFYKDLEQSQKIVINSGYGFMGAAGLNYNSPQHAGLITKYGRDILNLGVQLATGKNAEEWKNITLEDVEEENEDE